MIDYDYAMAKTAKEQPAAAKKRLSPTKDVQERMEPVSRVAFTQLKS